MKTLLFGFLLLLACAPLTPEKFAADKPLYEHALNLYEKGNISDSIPFFESLRNRFPQSPYLIDAELKIAEARFKNRDFAEAEVDLKTFQTLHPTHPKIRHVTYLLGMTHYERIPGGIDRDQTQTELALRVFTDLSRRWPGTEETKKAEPRIKRCRYDLLRRELYVANFYLKQKKYAASMKRLQTVRSTPEFQGLQSEATYKLALAHYKLQNYEQAKELALLAADDGNTPKWQTKAKRLLKKIEPFLHEETK